MGKHRAQISIWLVSHLLCMAISVSWYQPDGRPTKDTENQGQEAEGQSSFLINSCPT